MIVQGNLALHAPKQISYWVILRTQLRYIVAENHDVASAVIQVTLDFKLALPQVAVVGSQSSGKSSVLEALVSA